MMMTTKKIPIRHLSASSLTAFNDCPMTLYGKLLFKWPESIAPQLLTAMRVGSAVHRALEVHHKGGNAIGQLCKESSLDDESFRKALGFLQAYTANEQPHPKDVCEEKFSIQVPGVPVPVIGYIDRYRGLDVHEYKTTSSSNWWTQERVDTSPQVGLYCMARSRANRGAQITANCHIMQAEKGEFTHNILTTTRNKAQLFELEDYVRDTWKSINDGELVAKCAPGKCRYPTQCREYGYQGTDSLELPF